MENMIHGAKGPEVEYEDESSPYVCTLKLQKECLNQQHLVILHLQLVLYHKQEEDKCTHEER